MAGAGAAAGMTGERSLFELRERIPQKVYALLESRGFTTLRPAQVKAIAAGLFDDSHLLVCTPTASGKTLVAELAALNGVLHDRGKALYIVPLRALASEKYRQFKRDYPSLSIAMSTGDLDETSGHLGNSDIVIVTSEKLDSLLRHRVEWLARVKTVIIDEVHLLNDPGRGPTLEIVITILKRALPKAQLIALSATIGNKEELAAWLDAELVEDAWRPVRLEKGVYLDGSIEFVD